MESKMNERFVSLLDQFAQKKVLVIGDVMLDKYILGDVSRISPEAPIPVLRVTNETYAPGGASNVAANLSALGGVASLAGIVGDDEAKGILFGELERRMIGTKGVFVDKEWSTIQKVRVVSRGYQLLRFDYEHKPSLSQESWNALRGYLDYCIPAVDAVVISDYAKGVVTEITAAYISAYVRYYGKPLVVDPKPKHTAFYKGASLITPNAAEALEMSALEENADVVSIGETLRARLKANILVTRGEHGMSLFDLDGTVEHLPARTKKVYSLIGAGDTVVAVAALSLSSGATLREAMILSNIAAGIKVGKQGTATVTVDEIKKEIEKNEKGNILG